MSFYTPPPIRLHDLTHTPVGLWQFQGTPNDSSGQGNNLTWAGTQGAIYSSIGGLKSALFRGSNYLSSSVAAVLQIAGDITIESIIAYSGTPGDSLILDRIIGMGIAGAAENQNVLYSVATGNGDGLAYFSESGTGVGSSVGSDPRPPAFVPHHAAWVRDSDVWKTYVNGVLVDTATSLTTPTGGGLGFLRVGADENAASFLLATMASLKIIASALTTAQVLAEARLCGFT